MLLSPEIVEIVILANCALHNFLRSRIPSEYTPLSAFDAADIEHGLIQAEGWRSQAERGMQLILPAQTGHNYKRNIKLIRNDFCTYFNGSDAVQWQNKFV